MKPEVAGAFVLAIAQAIGCAPSSAAPSPAKGSNAPAIDAGAPPNAATATGCQDKHMQAETMTFRESTNPTVSDHQVGISNIYERDLPDAKGVVASRLSAVLSIFDPATKDERSETVITGSEVALGADRYCVVAIDKGQKTPGSISMRKLAP